MHYFKIFLTVLSLFINVSDQEEYTPKVETTEGQTYILFSMKVPSGSILRCPGGKRKSCAFNTIDQGHSISTKDISNRIYCKEPWVNSFTPGNKSFTAVLFKNNCRMQESHTFIVKFTLPETEIDCPNYVDDTIYARKNATIYCGCRLKNPGFPKGNAMWMKDSMIFEPDKQHDLRLKIEESKRIKAYQCAGTSLLGMSSVNITNVVALSENYPSITAGRISASKYAVACDGTFPNVDVTLTCGNYTASSGIQSTTLIIAIEPLSRHLKSCDCQVVMRNGPSFNSTKAIEIPDVTDNDDNDNDKWEDSGDKTNDKGKDSGDNDNDKGEDSGGKTNDKGEDSGGKTNDKGEDSDDSDEVDGEGEDEEDRRQIALLPQISLNINRENVSLHIMEGANMSIECHIESPGRHLMTIQRDGETLIRDYEFTMEATCKDSGQYMCVATDQEKNVSNSHTVDVFVKCAPVLEEYENVTRSYSTSNDSSVHVEVDVVGYPKPKDFDLLKEVEREKRSPEANIAVSKDLYKAEYKATSPGRGKAHLVMVGVSANDTGKYIFVIKNGIGPGLKYRFRVKNKAEPVRVPRDLGVNVGALVGGVVAAVLVIIALIIVYFVIKKKDWLLADDDEESKMETKVEIYQFPTSPTEDVKPVLGEDDVTEKTEDDVTEKTEDDVTEKTEEDVTKAIV